MACNRLRQSDFFHLGILAGIGLLLGIYLIASQPLIANDGVFYIEQARRAGSDPAAVARRLPPGYPLLLWAAHALASFRVTADSPVGWARCAQGVTLLCRVLALVPLYLLGKRLVGPRDSFLALLILVMLPYPAYYGSDVLREWPYVLFLSLGFWMLYRGLQDGTWWPFAVAGLAAGGGYLIRPECAQLLIYGAFGLLLVGHHARRHGAPARDTPAPNEEGMGWTPRIRDGHASVLASVPAGWHHAWARWGAGFLLLAGFALPAVPCIRAAGTILPQQLEAAPSNTPPVILQAGGRPAGNGPLEFEVRAGQLLEVPIEAFDPEDQPLRFSLVGVPAGARPVYQFRSVATGAPFWTLAEDEKDTLLTAYCPRVWQYDGIVCYTYAQAGAPAGLQPVHRFWSATQQRHFYTLSDSEKEALRQTAATRGGAALPEANWQYEGIVFYAFPADSHPPDAVAVYRSGSGPGITDGGLRIADSTPGTNPQSAIVNPQSPRVAWYVPRAGHPPAGVTVENQVLRWWPRPDQQGEYQINILVSDGRFSTCQLVKIRVQAPAAAGVESQPAGPAENQSSSTNIRTPAGGNSHFELGNPKQTLMSQTRNPKRDPGARPCPRPMVGTAHPTTATKLIRWAEVVGCHGYACVAVLVGHEKEHAYASVGMAPGQVPNRGYPRFWGGRSSTRARQYAGVAQLPKAVNQLFDAITEDLMVVFLVPWVLGLYYRLRHQAGRTERVLVLFLLLVNVAAMLARHAWIAPGENRRYSLGLLALTIFYVPSGLQILAGWLERVTPRGWRIANCGWKPARQANHQSSIINPQYILLALGIGACIFRLSMAPKVDKSSYRVMARWLQQNTAPEAVVAVPDVRISFYADRPAVLYQRQFDPRRVDYAIKVEDQDQPAVPAGWRREYALPFNRGKGGKMLVAYRTLRTAS